MKKVTHFASFTDSLETWCGQLAWTRKVRTTTILAEATCGICNVKLGRLETSRPK